MARAIRYGVVRNGEHVSIHADKDSAEIAAQAERAFIIKCAADGWITERGAQDTRIWVEEVKGNVW